MIRGILIVLHLVLGLSAAGAGQALVRKPSGEDLTFKTEWLHRSPFRDYRIPGMFMVLVIAPLNLLASWSQARGRPAGPYLSLSSGVILVVWLVIQTAIIGLRHPSQAIWAVIFPLTAALGFVQLRQLQGE